jgi:hypothetical protein
MGWTALPSGLRLRGWIRKESQSMTVETLDVDIAKNVFQLHGVNRNGRVVLKRRVMRDQLVAALTQIEGCIVVIEACTGAFY